MKPLLACVAVVFTVFTLWVLGRTGLIGFYERLLATEAGWQVLADITIALVLVLTWIWRDARTTARRFWPYAALTLALGSIGPLLYLLLRPQVSTAPRTALQA